jgi:hypothetical protein
MDQQIVAGYRRLVLAVTRRPDDDDFLPLRECDIETIQEIMQSLDEKFPDRSYSEILTMRFNLDGEGIRIFRKIGEQFHVSAERIRQKEKKALRLLRHPSRRWRLMRLFRSVLEEQLEDVLDAKRQLEYELSQIKEWKRSEEAKAKREDFLNGRSVWDVSIDELYLTVRADSCLYSSGIDTLGKLLQKTVADLLEIKNFGRRSLWNVKEKLDENGFSLAKTGIE